MTYTSKIATAITTVALIAGSVVPAAFANTKVNVDHNGVFSHTSVNVSNHTGTNVTQNNVSGVVTVVNSTANTGDNHASFNTGGGNIISTGPATSKVNVTIGGSSNTATVLPTPTTNTTVNVSHNGVFSKNKVKVSNSSWLNTVQQNFSFIFTGVNSNSNTGGNSSSFNTHGVNGIGTDAATSTVNITVNGSSNTLK